MKLNEKQKTLCLEHALGEFLSGWKGTAQEAWQRLQDLSDQESDISDFDEKAGVAVSGAYEHLYLGDIVSHIDDALFSHEALVEGAIKLIGK